MIFKSDLAESVNRLTQNLIGLSARVSALEKEVEAIQRNNLKKAP